MLFRLMRPILNVWNHGKSTRPSLVRGSELSICFSFFCMEFHIFALKIRTPKVGAAAYEAKAVFQK